MTVCDQATVRFTCKVVQVRTNVLHNMFYEQSSENHVVCLANLSLVQMWSLNLLTERVCGFLPPTIKNK